MHRIIGLLLTVSSPLFAQHWTSLKTPHFEIYSTKDQPAALEDLQELQTINSFFEALQPFGKISDTKPIQVISFRSKNEYTPYAFRSESGGYYFHTEKNDYILIGDTGPRERAMVQHEFTHLVVTQAGLTLPIWLNEGLADFYSTVEVNGTQATVGRPPNLYMETVRNARFLPWDTLFAVDAGSSMYSVGENLAHFYSQSWALIHMLKLDESYAPRFQQFLTAVSEGQSSKEALQAVYHKSMAQIDSDLSAYFKKRKLPVAVIDGMRPADYSAPIIAEAADFDIQFALATVLAWKANGSEGLEKLANLSARYPDRPGPEEELGWLVLRQKNKEEARRHFEAAVQRHSKDPEILFNTAELEKEAGAKYAQIAPLFRQALAIEPNMDSARLELGLLEYQNLQYKAALSLLSGMSTIPDDDKFEAYLTMAQCYSNLDDFANAETYVKKAAQSARNDDQKEDAASLLETVQRDKESGSVPASAAKVESKITNARGMTKTLQCEGTKKLLTLAIDGGASMTFDISDPDLVVRHPSDTYSRWACGPLKPEPLTIVYATPTNPAEKTAGKAIELVF